MGIYRRIVVPFFLSTLIYVNSGALWSISQPFELLYSQEIYLSLLVLVCSLYLINKWASGRPWIAEELFVLALTPILLVIPALFAYLNFGQPVFYGVIEERRALSYLVFFPVYFAISKRYVSVQWVVKVILVICVVNIVNTFYAYMNIRSQVVIDALNSMNARFDRTIIGQYYMLFAYMLVLWDWLKNNKHQSILILLGILAYFLIFVQTKQMILVLSALTVIVVMRDIGKSTWLILVTLVVTIFLVNYIDMGYFFDKYRLLFQLAVQNTDSIRASTASIIMSDMSDMLYLLGKGSLSLMWHGGFQQFFGENFYLSDVGILGSYYRFGVLAIPLVVLYYYFYYYSYRRLGVYRNEILPKALISFIACSAALNVLIPIIEYNGYYMGLILALMAGYRKEKSIEFTPVSSGGQKLIANAPISGSQ